MAALSEHEDKGVKFAYLHYAQLMGNHKILREESLVSDLEYADDMSLFANTWDDLPVMLEPLFHHCSIYQL